MVKPLRRGKCPGCGRACRRKLLHWADGLTRMFQPYCARCTFGRRGRHWAGRYHSWPPAAGVKKPAGQGPAGSRFITWSRCTGGAWDEQTDG